MVVGAGFILVALLLAGAAAHPLVTYPWSLRFFRRHPAPAAPAPGALPSVAICMSAFNEERTIVQKAHSLIAMADSYGNAEILIYVDGQRDRTLELLGPFRDRIRVISSDERRGKTAGLKMLVAASSSELLAFTDANVVTPADGLLQLEAAMRDPAIGCAGARLVYSNVGETQTSDSGAAYWSHEERIKLRESESVGVIGVDGAFFMIRRAAYNSPPDDIIDDLYVSLAALIDGYHVVSVPGVVVQERSATSAREEFQRKVRISCQAMNVHRLLWPRLRGMRPGALYGYVSHRLLKWLIPYTLLGAGICGVIGAAILIGPRDTALFVLVAAAGVGIGLAAHVRIVERLVNYVVMLAGVGLGVFQSFAFNRRYVTWKPAVSVRAAGPAGQGHASELEAAGDNC